MSLIANQTSHLESPLSPLTLPDQIRLLHLQPRAVGKEISCTIEHVKLSDTPKYESLSYVWGPKVMKTISLNGRDFEVRENLFNALSHLRFVAQPRVLWIDAICINQSDSNERNHQVSQMGLIYSQAISVVVWLGMPDDSSAAALKFFQSTPSNVLRRLGGSEMLAKLSHTEEGVRIFGAVHSLSKREYWHRLWIVQEFLLASEKIIQCGSYSFPGDRLSGFFIALSNWSGCHYNNRQIDPVLSRAVDSMNQTRMSLLIQAGWCMLGEDRLGDRLGGSLTILYSKHNTGKCENELDKVFGLWALANKCCQDAVPIDYSLAMDQLMGMVRTHNKIAHTSSGRRQMKSYQMTRNEKPNRDVNAKLAFSILTKPFHHIRELFRSQEARYGQNSQDSV